MSRENDSAIKHEPGAAADHEGELTWRRARSEELMSCRIFRVRRDWSIDPRDGREHDFFVMEAPDWINVVPLTVDGQVIMVEQYRHGSSEVALEIPGGMVDQGETPEEAATRELLEETGYAPTEVIDLGSTRPNPAIQNNWLHTFLACDVHFSAAPVLEETEHLAVRLVPLAHVPDLIARGIINHSLVLVAFLRFFQYKMPNAFSGTNI